MAAGTTRLLRWGMAAVLMALAAPAVAATSVQVPLQGVARTQGGGPVADGAYVFFLRLYDSPTAAKPLWQEVNAKVAIEGGLFAVNAGAVEGAGIPLAVFSGGGPLWLGVQVSSDPELPRVQVATAPFAAFAHQAQVAASATFPWAAADQPGGAAKALACTGCIGPEQLAAGAVAASHVAFGYAASDQKGGSATHALAADVAKVADQAQFAVNAKAAQQAQSAVSAEKATAAASASALQCSGCIGPDHLSVQVAQAFLSTQGGAVSGKVTIQGGLDLAEGTLSGGQFAAVDTSQAPCTPNMAGRVVLDGVQKRLYFCDGTGWRRLSSCTAACKDAALVACGQPITDDCGELGTCPGKGSFCAAGQTCSGGVCVSPGQSKESAVKSCKALLASAPGTKSGLFWLDPDGGDAANAFQAWCDMTTDGGGWTLVMKLSAGNFCFGASTWTDSQPYNAAKMLDASMPAAGEYDAKSSAFDALADVTALRFDTSRSKSVQVGFVQASSPRTLMTTNTVDFTAYPNYGNWADAFGHDRSQAPIFMRAGVAVTKGNTCRTNPGNTPSGCGKPCVFCYQAADGNCCGCEANQNDVNSGIGQNAAYCGGGQGICSTAGVWSDASLRTLVWAR